jgi:hypothetical protein
MNDRTGPSCNERFSSGDVIKTRSRYTFLFLMGCPKCEVTGYDKSVVSSVSAMSYVSSTYDTNVPVIRSSSFDILFWWLRLMCELCYFLKRHVGQCTCHLLYKRGEYLENYFIQYSFCPIINWPCHGSGGQSPALAVPWLR